MIEVVLFEFGQDSGEEVLVIVLNDRSRWGLELSVGEPQGGQLCEFDAGDVPGASRMLGVPVASGGNVVPDGLEESAL